MFAGLLFNAFWLGRRSKKNAATSGVIDVNQSQEPKLPQMAGLPPHMANTGMGLRGQGPAELDGTMYIGSELPTLGNTAEMEGQSASGYRWQQQQQYMGQQGVGHPVEMADRR